MLKFFLSLFIFLGSLGLIFSQQDHVSLTSYDGTSSSIVAKKSITLQSGFTIPSGKNVRLFIQSHPNLLHGFSANQNYILTRTFRKEVKSSQLSDIRPVNEENQTIQYFDGLGRPIQTVQVMASPPIRILFNMWSMTVLAGRA